MSIKNSAKQLKSIEKIIIAAMRLKFPLDFPNNSAANKRLWEELLHYKTLAGRINTTEKLYRHLLKTLVNRNMLPSVITLDKKETEYIKLLHNWNPWETLKSWGNRQEELANKIFKISGGKGNTPGRLCIGFAKGVIEGAELMSRYGTIKDFWDEAEEAGADKEFKGGLKFFKNNPITGMGPALSLHFFQRLGLPFYAKPDTHVKDVMKNFAWIADSENDDTVIMQTISDIHAKAGDPYVPYVIDKLLWITGSGTLCDTKPAYELGTLKKDLKNI